MTETTAQRQLLAEAALKVIVAYRERLRVDFLDGQRLLIRNASWGRDICDEYDAVIADADVQGVSRSLRFYTSEISRLVEPNSEEIIFQLPAAFRVETNGSRKG